MRWARPCAIGLNWPVVVNQRKIIDDGMTNKVLDTIKMIVSKLAK